MPYLVLMTEHSGPEQASTIHRPQPVTEQRHRRQALSEDRKRLFLSELRVHGVVVEASRIASPGSSHERGARTTFYEERSRNAEFAQAWDEAIEQANGALEMEIFRRGVLGFEEERVDSQGRVTILKKFSDACILAQARSRLPQYRKKDVSVDKKVSGTVRHEHTGTIRYEDCTPEQRRHIRRFLESAPRSDVTDN